MQSVALDATCPSATLSTLTFNTNPPSHALLWTLLHTLYIPLSNIGTRFIGRVLSANIANSALAALRFQLHVCTQVRARISVGLLRGLSCCSCSHASL